MAFTLIELLCVIGIIAVITAILIPVIGSTQRRGRSTACLSNMRQLSAALQSYTQDYDGGYPSPINVSFGSGSPTTHNQTGVSYLWYEFLKPYTGNHILVCPDRIAPDNEAKEPEFSGYALNSALSVDQKQANETFFVGRHESDVRLPANTVIAFDVRASIIALDRPDNVTNLVNANITSRSEYREYIAKQPGGAVRHNDGGNYAFADGHARWLRPSSFVRDCNGDKPCFHP